jgi:hypothetical protein
MNVMFETFFLFSTQQTVAPGVSSPDKGHGILTAIHAESIPVLPILKGMFSSSNGDMSKT